MPIGVYERKLKPIKDRLFAKVAKAPGDGCWLWTGSTSRFGHGQISNGQFKPGLGVRQLLTAHRVSYELEYGPIPNGLFVLHKCDVPNCVRPSHLFLGTKQDNSNDMVSKNRSKKGSDLPQSKLTEDQVRAIRASTRSHSKTAAAFGISITTVSFIKNRIRWTHVE